MPKKRKPKELKLRNGKKITSTQWKAIGRRNAVLSLALEGVPLEEIAQRQKAAYSTVVSDIEYFYGILSEPKKRELKTAIEHAKQMQRRDSVIDSYVKDLTENSVEELEAMEERLTGKIDSRGIIEADNPEGIGLLRQRIAVRIALGKKRKKGEKKAASSTVVRTGPTLTDVEVSRAKRKAKKQKLKQERSEMMRAEPTKARQRNVRVVAPAKLEAMETAQLEVMLEDHSQQIKELVGQPAYDRRNLIALVLGRESIRAILKERGKK